MKKKVLILMFLFIFGVGSILSGFGFENFAKATSSVDSLFIRAYGDSISAGDKLNDVNDSYPSVFANAFNSNFNVDFVAKGVSGDTTHDLLEDLNPYIEGTAVDQIAFDNAEVITLCIGANNVLKPALANLSGYLSQSVSKEDLQALLDAGVEDFKNEFPQILQAFEGKKIVVMTVYNPFKYLSLNDVSISAGMSGYASIIRSILSQYDNKLQEMLVMSIDSLKIINEEIRNSADENIYVADIWQLFDSFTKEQYLEYINADISKVEIASLDVASIMSEIASASDPHPTKAGHEIIANEHLKAFKYFKLSTNDDFSAITKGSDKIALNLQTIENDNFTFKLKKTSANVESTILQSSQMAIEVLASSIKGQGKLYIEVYDESQNHVFTTNSIDYDVDYEEEQSFVLTSNKNEVQNKDEIIDFTVNSSDVENAEFSLIRVRSGVRKLLQTNTTGRFSVLAIDLEGRSELFVEVYSDGNLISKTNSMYYFVEFERESPSSQNSAKLENLILISSIVLVSLVSIVWIIVVLARLKKRNSF